MAQHEFRQARNGSQLFAGNYEDPFYWLDQGGAKPAVRA